MPPRIADLVRGRWRGVLLTLGVVETALTGKHTACPGCGGTDRFRFDNKEGRGTWICSRCGAGDGFDLLKLAFGWSFAEAAKRIEACIGEVAPEPVTPKLARPPREPLRDLWKQSTPFRPGDPVDQYLQARGLLHDCPPALRYAPSCYYGPGVCLPAMVAVVSGPDVRPVTLHRTYLEGPRKAPVEEPRKLMPGSVPVGAAVRLAEPGEMMGIAEGIETALAAAALFGIPVWSAISASILEKWAPPEECRRVIVFADADRSFRGQAASYQLARRLVAMGLDAEVQVPPTMGTDWNDVLLSRGRPSSPGAVPAAIQPPRYH
jgi:putative DNA primase/helicase